MVGFEKLYHKLLKDEIHRKFKRKIRGWKAIKEERYYNGEKWRYIDVFLSNTSSEVPVEIGSTNKKNELLEEYGCWINVKRNGDIDFAKAPANIRNIIGKIVKNYRKHREEIKNLQKQIDSIREDFRDIEKSFRSMSIYTLNMSDKDLIFPRTAEQLKQKLEQVETE